MSANTKLTLWIITFIIVLFTQSCRKPERSVQINQWAIPIPTGSKSVIAHQITEYNQYSFFATSDGKKMLTVKLQSNQTVDSLYFNFSGPLEDSTVCYLKNDSNFYYSAFENMKWLKLGYNGDGVLKVIIHKDAIINECLVSITQKK